MAFRLFGGTGPPKSTARQPDAGNPPGRKVSILIDSLLKSGRKSQLKGGGISRGRRATETYLGPLPGRELRPAELHTLQNHGRGLQFATPQFIKISAAARQQLITTAVPQELCSRPSCTPCKTIAGDHHSQHSTSSKSRRQLGSMSSHQQLLNSSAAAARREREREKEREREGECVCWCSCWCGQAAEQVSSKACKQENM